MLYRNIINLIKKNKYMIFFLILTIAALILGILKTISWVIAIIIMAVSLVISLIAMYNKLVISRNRTEEAWSDIEVQLKRRYDLIPNLVNSVKGYATHESTAFQKVTEARAAALGAKTMNDHAKTEAMLGAAVSGIFGIAEAYPDLKANTNFINLQNELSDTENKIQAARRFYNGIVNEFNTAIQIFPANIFALFFRLKKLNFSI